MKKMIVLSLLLIMATATFSQQTKTSPSLTKQDYLKKSKHQKTAAWILVGGGASLMIIGIISTSVEDAANYIFTEDKSGFNTDMIFFYSGALATLGSIPLFIASGRNKRKAMSLSFKNESAPQIQKASFVYRAIPSLTLKINL